MEFVLGLDIGGTSSRAQVGDLDGRLVGAGAAGGGNPNSHPPEDAAAQVTAAARAALGELDGRSVRSAVLGMAGVSAMTDPRVAGLFEQGWNSLGLNCPVRVVSDCEVAFAAGTSAATGTVLIAGTGAIAARIEDHRETASAGGHGWLLGDEGSAFWLGREAVRHALRTLDLGAVPDAGLARSVLLTVLDEVPADEPVRVRKRLITAVNGAPPIRLAELAPLVTAACADDDPAGSGIVDRAAVELADTAVRARDSGPIVLAGGLTAEGNPVGTALRAELGARLPGTPLHLAGPGAAGAAWLAALDHDPAAPRYPGI
ncbi:N-acetylglucosamine kinase [Saccharopolyspora gloriosae]|uniref:N-acetylglucosamine kinase n=1 Tax=Saccharopolyspora gloriosae TaxID=455344 RepID=UPI001FB85A69|nr:BadF/BadG/BcrA/BcrD ATPase family protein [Saccharopolyspora gloriosae]